jgi:hypothetical protein
MRAARDAARQPASRVLTPVGRKLAAAQKALRHGSHTC